MDRLATASCIVLWVALLLVGCGDSQQNPSSTSVDINLLEVPRTDTTAFEEGVRQQLKAAFAAADDIDPEKDSTEAAKAYGELGRTLHAYELRDAAEAAYRNARALAPAEADWAYLLGVVLQEKGDFGAAAEAFEAVLELEPTDLPARIRLGDSLLQANRLPEARRHLEESLGLAPDTALAHFFLGQVELAEGNFEGASTQLEKALATQQDADRIHHALARAYRGLGDLEKAGLALEKAGDREVRLRDPRFQEMKKREVSAAGFVRRAARAQVAGALDEAVAAYRRAVEASPTSAEARAGLGATLAELGQPVEAEKELLEAIRLGGDNAWLRYNLAGSLRLGGQLDRALDEYRAALERDPKHVESHIGLADVLTQLRRPDEAMTTLRQALEIGQKKAQIHLSIAALHDALGQPQKAAQERRAALDSDPTPAERSRAHQQTAEAAKARGDLAAALGALENAVAADPSDLGARFSLANLLGAANRFDDAAAAYERVLEARPDRPEAWLGLATALALSSRPDVARQRLEQGIEQNPGNPNLTLALARLLITHPDPARRDPAKALMLLDQASESGATLQLVELKAIALAESGRFDEAIVLQSQLVDQLRAVEPRVVPAAEARLERYRQRAKESNP